MTEFPNPQPGSIDDFLRRALRALIERNGGSVTVDWSEIEVGGGVAIRSMDGVKITFIATHNPMAKPKAGRSP